MMDMENASAIKKLTRVERWLKRCMVACRCGSWSSALMEIECMEAEARELQRELWARAEGEALERTARFSSAGVLRWCKAAAIALIIVLACGLPLSVDQDRPFDGFRSDSLAVLTSTEGEILTALRETLSSGNTGRVLLSVEFEPDMQDAPRSGVAVAAESPRGGTPVRPPAVVRSVVVGETRTDGKRGAQKAESTRSPAEQQTRPSFEDVISLIQVGQRALRVPEPGVRVVP